MLFTQFTISFITKFILIQVVLETTHIVSFILLFLLSRFKLYLYSKRKIIFFKTDIGFNYIFKTMYKFLLNILLKIFSTSHYQDKTYNRSKTYSVE